jgi:L-fuconolactonase
MEASFPTGMIDIHVHLWSPEWLRYPWLAGLAQLNRPFLPQDFQAASAGAGLTGFIFVECGCEPSQLLAETDWVATLAKREPRLRGIVAQAPVERSDVIRDSLTALARRPLVKGVRRLLQGETQADFCLRPEFVAGVKLLADHSFTFDLCIRWEQLREVTELVRRVPEVQFVLDHLGKPPVRAGIIAPWAAAIKALAKLPNVSCKVSGLTTEADWQTWQPGQLQPYFQTVVEAFGYDRLLFGGDWPVATLATDYQRWVDTVASWVADGTVADREKLFQSNAAKVYRIS